MPRLTGIGRLTVIAVIVLAGFAVGVASMHSLALAIGLALAFAVSAFFSIWLANRHQRAAFAAKLSEEKLEELRGFEAARGWGSWRQFRRTNSVLKKGSV